MNAPIFSSCSSWFVNVDCNLGPSYQRMRFNFMIIAIRFSYKILETLSSRQDCKSKKRTFRKNVTTFVQEPPKRWKNNLHLVSFCSITCRTQMKEKLTKNLTQKRSILHWMGLIRSDVKCKKQLFMDKINLWVTQSASQSAYLGVVYKWRHGQRGEGVKGCLTTVLGPW